MTRKSLIVVVAAALTIGLMAASAPAMDWQQFKGTKLNVLGLQQAQAEGLKKLVPNFKELTGIRRGNHHHESDGYHPEGGGRTGAAGVPRMTSSSWRATGCRNTPTPACSNPWMPI